MVAKENRFERQKSIWDQDKLQKTRVLVTGAGTLGNEICKNLALVGIGHVTIIDFDIIEEVNLNRCLFFREKDIGRKKSHVLAERIQELNPEMEATNKHCDINTDIGAGLFLGFDIVLGGLDNIMAREKINKYTYWTGTPYIDGGIEGLNGQMQVIIPPETGCYMCSVPSEMYRMRNVHVSCSGTKLDSEGISVPMVATTASIIGALQVQEAINIIHTGDSKLKGRQLRFDQAHSYRKDIRSQHESSIHYDLYENKVEKIKRCTDHYCYKDKIIHLPLTEECTLENLIRFLRKKLDSDQKVNIRNDELMCYKIHCSNCGWKKPIFKLKKAIGIDINNMKCPECGEYTILDDSDDIFRLKYANKKICEFGAPDNHIFFVNRNIPIYLGSNKNKENRDEKNGRR